MSIICSGSLASAQQKGAGADLQSENRILVAYFSCTGNTEKVAQSIAQAVGGDLYQITPAVAYSPADLDWTDKASRSSVEMADSKSRPALAGKKINPKDYDVVFLGYPIWWNVCPRPVNSFIEKYDFSGMTIVPFATSGSSSIGNSVAQLKKLYPKINWKDGRLCNGSARQAAEWAQKVVR